MYSSLDQPYRKDLFVIKEDACAELKQENQNEMKNKLEFEDMVKKNAFRRMLNIHVKPDASSKNNQSDEAGDLYFLSKKSNLISQEEKTSEFEKYLAEQRVLNSDSYLKQKFDSVKENLNKNRNPNIKNLIKDLPAQTSLGQLQESLKNEFSMFITESVNNSVESVKRFSVMESNQQDDNDQDPGGFFLTQEADHEISEILKKDSKNNFKPSSTTKPEQSLEIKENLQIALVENENGKNSSESKASLIKLKNMLDSIKRIDLPKFQTELHQVCQYGNDPELLKFVSQSVENDLVKKQNGLGRYCIHECCIKGNLPMLKTLLPFVQDINCVDQNGQNAAHIAAKFGELECLKLLSANGIDLEKQDKYGMQPCHLAAAYNHTKIIEFVFEMGLSLNKRCNKGKLPFHYASEFGSFEALKQMSEYYVDISVPDTDGNTAAHLAAKNDKLNCLKYLIKLGLPVDKVKNNAGRNIPHMCCFHGAVRCLHWLFDKLDIDIDALDDSGNNLAHSCCLGGQAQCLNCCIQHDVRVDPLNKLGESPLDLARRVGKSLHIEKALKNQITCDDCVKDALRIKFEKENEKTVAEKTIEKNLEKMYNLPRENSSHGIKSSDADRLSSLRRDLVAQYFGPEI